MDWQACWWVKRGKGRDIDVVDEGLREGLLAYSCHQAVIRVQLKEKFELMWKSVDSWAKSGDVQDVSDENHLVEGDEDYVKD